MRQEIEVRGTTFASVQGAISDLRGQAFLERVVGAMPEESKKALRFGSVIASGWYPIAWYRELFASALELSGELQFPREIGRASIRREINGVHRLIFRIISVEMLQKQSSRFFGSYFRPTECTVERVTPNPARTLYRGCVGFDRNLWLEQFGCIEELMAQARVTAPRLRIVSGGNDGDDACEIESRWR